ncbi:calcium/sodium antiporter [Rhodobacteraceae bacterium DSL-40]|uniref:calcium/sodium antiporter n=1 Tax=Amaricoccus sp. B4 TaxID=3368557 RepID=UPI000DAD1A34
MEIVQALAGLVILIFAGDLLVRGAVALSLRLGVPTMVVGLTIVAFGTSLPELLVSIDATLSGAPAIALGNVVGSNITNVLLVLGVPAVMATVPPSGPGTSRNFAIMLAASVLLILLCAFGPLGYFHALVLLSFLAFVLFDMVREARRDPSHVAEEVSEHFTPMAGWKIAGALALGLVGLPLGASLLIDGAVGIARALGISEAVIGLTLVAVGTSLPELATTVMAAVRRHADVAMGNVLGSNLFNILAILGITSLFGPLPVGEEFLTRDLWVMLGASLLLAPFILRHRPIGRMAGIAFLVIYAAYYALLFSHAGGSA